MNSAKYLVLLKINGEFCDKTSEIKTCNYNSFENKYEIVFNNSHKTYHYNNNNILFFNKPKIITPNSVKLTHNTKVLYNIKNIYSFDNQYLHIIYDNGFEKTYKNSEINIESSCLSNKASSQVLKYLKLVANEISLKTEDGYKILSPQYEEMEKFIGENSACAKYLSGSQQNKIHDDDLVIFPFGSNASQTTAVKTALTNQISIIEGPPGTGKTQTILNIIANLIIRGKTVQIVSNNNSATENVYEKLCKQNYGFLVAQLGRKGNKEKFIKTQSGKLPNLQDWEMNNELKAETNSKINNISQQLDSAFKNQNKSAKLKQELSDLKTEQTYFNKQCENTNIPIIKCKPYIKSFLLLKLWKCFEKNSFLLRLFNSIFFIFCFGIKNKNCLNFNTSTIISIIKRNYYILKSSELNKEISKTQNNLNKINSKKLLDEYVNLSSKIFKDFLFQKYGKNTIRRKFNEDDLWKNPNDFVKEYPVVLSTTYSARNNLGSKRNRFVFDYIIMDEASQVDVVTGTISLSIAKNAIIVGDKKQLPNVIKKGDEHKADDIFSNFNINKNFDFSKNSFLSSVSKIIPNVTSTPLKEHYRCHPKIIEFCNKKFYNSELIIMTKDSGEKDTLKVYKTVMGNHARGFVCQRQIDEITQNILPNLQEKKSDIGIIAPYNEQANEIYKNVKNDEILISTIHKFQGREKGTMIMSTVEDEISPFVDDKNLLNVAVSRAINHFYIIVNPNKINEHTNIGDLVNYIEYNNFEIIESDIYSIFDYLYKQYENEKLKILKNSKKVSIYDSENLMYYQLTKILKENNYTDLDIIPHLPLKEIFKDLTKLNTEEYNFVTNTDSHVDFMIYNKITKRPILAVEVDGYYLHKEGTKQQERDILKNGVFEKYHFPILRFKTNGSNEEKIILSKLKDILKKPTT